MVREETGGEGVGEEGAESFGIRSSGRHNYTTKLVLTGHALVHTILGNARDTIPHWKHAKSLEPLVQMRHIP